MTKALVEKFLIITNETQNIISLLLYCMSLFNSEVKHSSLKNTS